MSSTNKFNNILKKVDDKISELVSRTNEFPLMSWSIASIPVFGPIIQTVLTMLESTILRSRMSDLVLSLHEEIQRVDLKKLDNTYFETEEFYDMLRRVMEYTMKTRDRNKIRLYARILVRVPILDNAIYRSNAEDFLSILLELSEADLHLAREVFKQQANMPDEINDIEQNELNLVKSSGWDNLRRICKMNRAEFDLSVTKLVRAGLLRQVVGSYVSYIGDAYRVTSTFRKLILLVDKLD